MTTYVAMPFAGTLGMCCLVSLGIVVSYVLWCATPGLVGLLVISASVLR